MSEQSYIITMTPVDSFTFSGENSMTSKGSDSFMESAGSLYADRRSSFLVKTESMPPQTSVMGAVRHYLIKNGFTDIGEKSFNIAEPPKNMGGITRISPVCVTGVKDGRQVLCVPSPKDRLYADKAEKALGGDASQAYLAMKPEEYDPKEFVAEGLLVYPLEESGGVVRLAEKQAAVWTDAARVFKKSMQAQIQTRDRNDDASFHMLERCRLRDADVDTGASRDGKAYLRRPAFCVVVTLNTEVPFAPAPCMLSIGWRDSMFLLQAKGYAGEGPRALKPMAAIGRGDTGYRAALLSPAFLPEDWREREGLVMAFMSVRPMRCATSDKHYSLRLIGQMLMFADTGSVFVFKTEEQRNRFADEIENSPLSVCGLNQCMRYQ